MRSCLVALVFLSCNNDGGVKVYNTPPEAAILNPPDGSEVDEGTVVTIQGLVDDSQDDPDALQVSISSDLDGVLAGGTSDNALAPDATGQVTFSTANLQPGNHAITLDVIDTDGETDDDVIALTVLDLPDDPEIAIAAPIAGAHGDEGTAVEFRAAVSDKQDPYEALVVTITSSIEKKPVCEMNADVTGVAECSAELSAGEHLLTYTVTDTDGRTGEATLHFEVLSFEEQDQDHDGWTKNEGDCNDTDPSVHPGASEYANGEDDDCDGTTDEGTGWFDDDGDGQTEEEGDCNDADDSTWRGAPEVCDDVDNDCDKIIDEGTSCYDDDADGYTESDGDCNDAATDIHPDATETADGVDEDCDGYEDEGTSAFDDDGDCACETAPCAGTFAVGCAALEGGDCDDANASVNPSATELCNAIDDDCDGTRDEGDAKDADTWYKDTDGDTYGDPLTTTTACSMPSGYADDGDDCDDADVDVNPGETEVCDTIDNDCDGGIDVGLTSVYFEDADGDGYGDALVSTAACSRPSGYSANDDDCDDSTSTTNPGASEYCNGVDDNCDATIDEDDAVDADTWYQDDDDDGWGDALSTTESCTEPSGYVADDGDCDDLEPLVHPGVDETCNLVDDDCDDEVDEDDAIDAQSWWIDDDGDGYGTGSVAATACYAPSGTIGNDDDCDDDDAKINPAATEACNGLDDNCDGMSDDGVTVTYYRDADGDGYGTSATTSKGCSAPSGYVSNDDDCNDANGSLNPDTEWWIDADSDGYGNPAYTLHQCTTPSGYTDDASDCDDGDDDIHPGATETCNDVDDDCDGSSDETGASGCSNWYYDYDNDGYGIPYSKCECDSTGSYRSTNNDDCYDFNSSANPAATATYHTSNRGDGSYDYDCDGSSTKQYTANYDCDVDWTGFACDSYTSGWSTSTDPSCGATGTWDSGCSASWFSCNYSSATSRTQACR